MTVVPSKALVPAYAAVHEITPVRQAYVYHDKTRNGFRFVGYGLQKEDDTYGPKGRPNETGGKIGAMVDIYV